ncbi:MAG TPA: lipid-A-disaccharide synthase, partial [Thermoanaerobaculia bacterium]|nr:lipid-A-disaccharide synthase [Thermoanaerobaculia bacterium]
VPFPLLRWHCARVGDVSVPSPMKLAIVAGEASGDLHAASVLRELKTLVPELQVFGIGGDLVRKEGAEILYHARDLGFVGFFNVLLHLPFFRRVFRSLMERVAAERPDAVLLVDYPGFNLRVARRASELGLKVIYFISPQVWAWNRRRVHDIARWVDHMIVILPFEEQFYREHNVRVTYVGHPLIDQVVGVKRPEKKDGRLRIALMPGSRRREVDDVLPAMLEAVAILRRERELEPYIVQAPTIEHDHIEGMVAASGQAVPILPRDRGEALAAADVAISSSGTATLEAAVLGTPVVVMYRLGRLTYLLARWLVRLPYFSLVNIVAGRGVVPELMQDEVTGENIAAAVRELMAPERYEQARADMAEVRQKLGDRGASRRAAEAIMATLR